MPALLLLLGAAVRQFLIVDAQADDAVRPRFRCAPPLRERSLPRVGPASVTLCHLVSLDARSGRMSALLETIVFLDRLGVIETEAFVWPATHTYVIWVYLR